MTSAPTRPDVLMPFPLATGRGLKVAVIDSGVNLRHPHIFAKTHAIAIAGGEPDDSVGHGTAVMAAIQETAPDAEFWSVKVFGPSLRTSSSVLIEALEWTLDNKMDVVNLSLGTPNQDYEFEMQLLVLRAGRAGTILVSAMKGGDKPVLPGTLPGVIGVDVDWELARNQYRLGDSCFCASGFPRSLPGMTPARNLNGVSFAVANMTGFVARGCQDLVERPFHSVHTILREEAARLERVRAAANNFS